LVTLEENIGKSFENVSMYIDFLNKNSTAQEIKARIDKWDCIKLESFYRAKQTKDKLQNGRKSLTVIHQIKD
jgi:hypothetical protein